MRVTKHKGKVIIAGAGCGDPELLTLKAARYLQQADTVLTDRLVSKAILAQWVSPEAEIIYVGKQCRRGASTPQQTINALLVEHASAGKLVVRLKGGDVSLFSNILDELETLVSNGITYEIIPGITAALGAAAYAGIPLTARGYATAVRFLTCHQPAKIAEPYWEELARTEDTLVFYMSAETLDTVVEKLLAHRIEPGKKLALVQQATTPYQRVEEHELEAWHRANRKAQPVSPSLVIIGRVAGLHATFGWLPNSGHSKNYFSPLARPSESILTTHKDIQHVSRA